MPSQFDLYRVRGHELNDDFFNLRFRNIDARLTALETQIFDLDTIADSLVSRGLDLITVQLNQAVSNVEEQIIEVETLALEVTSAIETLEDQIEDILSGGNLPAANITVSAITNMTATDAQAAFAELQGDIDTIVGTTISGIQSDITDLEGEVANLSASLTSKANLSSPNFSGTPTAPTPDQSNNSTRIATTAFVKTLFSGQVPTSRLIQGGGLVTGGGDLAQDRTLTVAKAAASDFRTGTDDTKALTTKTIYDSAVFSTITFSSNLVMNFNDGLNREVTLAGSFTLANPSNAKPGQSGCLKINTNGTNRTIAFGSTWKAEGGPLAISTTNTTDYLFFTVITSSLIIYSIVKSPT